MTRTDNRNPGLLDFKFINGIPILDAAKKMGVETRGDGRIVCWRSSNHPDEASPFLVVLPSSNKVVCPACDTYPMNVLDMVKDFGEFETTQLAAEYVAAHFKVPWKLKGSHLNNPMGETVPPACRDPLALLIKPGVWADLSVPAQRLIPVLLKLAKWEESSDACVLRVSNFAMMRYSGIRSPNSISQTIVELEAIGWLERLPLCARGDSPIKDTAQYRLTPLSPRVRNLADATAQKFSERIREEKAFRKQKRRERDFKRMFPSNETDG